jgi:signal transduction histidine kinase
MKLLVKTSFYYLFFSIPILLLSGYVCYYVITSEVRENNHTLLSNRKKVIEKYLKNNDTAALDLITKSGEAQIFKTLKPILKENSTTFFSDTLIFDSNENELAPNRMLSSVIKIGKTNYQIKIWRSTLEYDELFQGIFYLLVLILFFLFLTSVLINIWISKNLWKSFNSTLLALKSFEVSENKIPVLEKSSIIEFDVLNNSLTAMMNKMISDYSSQKKFTENASHEIQTPLAVIKAKIDLLFQSQNLKENEINLIVAIEDACSKMSKLNKSLLLLTKIENRQFHEYELVSFEKTLKIALAFFSELIDSNQLDIIIVCEQDFCVQMNPDLCLILINNFLQNAIRYNVKNGKIEIFITKDKIRISNNGKNEAIEAVLFERFQKNSTLNQSLGLGLSIIKEIIQVSGLQLHYHYSNDLHQFNVSFKNKS